MKAFILSVFCVSMLVCGFANAETDPCIDTVYNGLKSKSIDDLSQREFDMYKQKDAACNQYRNTQAMMKPAQNVTKNYNSWMVALLVVSFLPLLLI